ncbi:MAG: ubiquitin-like small modifier protein 1 [Chloroflexota bacterium]
MLVNFYATLRQVVGGKSVNFELPAGTTVRQLLDEMLRRYPALRPELLDEHGNLYAHVHIFVNGRDTPFLENAMDTELMEEDTIGVFPAVGGG